MSSTSAWITSSTSLALVLALPSPAPAPVIDLWLDAVATTTTTVPGAQDAPDLTDVFDAVYDFENSGTIGENESATICGSDCTMTTGVHDGLPTQNTTIFLVGSASANRQFGGDSFGIRCSGITEGACAVGSDEDGVTYTRMCWMYHNTTTNLDYVWWNKVGSNGAQLLRSVNISNDAFFQSCDGSGCGGIQNNTPVPAEEWHHWGVSHSSAGRVRGWLDGDMDGEVTGFGAYTNGAPAGRQHEFAGANPAGNWQGQMDECAYIKEELTEAQITHVAACGVDGPNGPCECNGDGTYADDGRKTTLSLPGTLDSTGCLTGGGLIP